MGCERRLRGGLKSRPGFARLRRLAIGAQIINLPHMRAGHARRLREVAITEASCFSDRMHRAKSFL
jgi:hypothetical protein